MSEWRKVKLGDCCDITSSKRCLASVRTKEGIPFFCSKEIILLDKGENVEPTDFIPEEIYESVRDKFGVPKAGDLLLTTRGTNGIPYIYKESDKFYFADGNLSWFKNFKRNISNKYLYYWFKSAFGKHEVDAIAKGTAQKAVPIEGLRRIELKLPPLSTQHRIATTISRYDSLIDNYQKQIKLLEEAAQRLYKEWFVNLRFPGHENTKIVDGVPEGWEKKKLEEIADIIMGQSPKSEFYNKEQKGLPFHQGVGSYGTRFVNDIVYTTSYTRIAEANSLLFSVRAPVGRLNISKNKIVIGRGLAAMKHKNGMQSFLFYMLKERFFKDNIIGNGSIFASISKNELLNLRFIIPANSIIYKYERFASDIDAKIQKLDSQLRLLTESRDRLLPKLLSGEIEV